MRGQALMRVRLCVGLWVGIGMATACVPNVVHTTPFNPAPELDARGAYAARPLFDKKTGGARIGDREVFDTAAVITTPESQYTLALHRFDNVFDLTVMIENRSSEDITVSPSSFHLLTYGRTLARPIAAHDAANLFLSRTSSYVPLPPKYEVSATSRLTADGSVRTDATIQQDQWDALTNSIGHAIVSKGNAELRSIAGMLYQGGMANSETIPATTRIVRDIFWLADTPTTEKPGAEVVTIVISRIRREVSFRNY
jgi:hypothetical protein